MGSPNSYANRQSRPARNYSIPEFESITWNRLQTHYRRHTNAPRDRNPLKTNAFRSSTSAESLPRNATFIDLTDEMDEVPQPSPVSMTSDNGEKAAPTSPVVVASPKETVEATSKKRSSTDRSEEDGTPEEPSTKRRRVDEPKEYKPRTPSPTPEPALTAEATTTPLYDDAPRQLLQRSCALVLDKVGFDSASKEAMEALCAEVDTYMAKLLSYVTESMLAARRSFPTPPDFEFAMRHMGLTSRLLKPHLKPPIPPEVTKLVFPPPDAEEVLPQTPAKLLGKELSGESDKRAKKYIPKSFPAFPSKHTYKSTAVINERENDPRKIREKATQAARNAEEALRRLVKVAKTGGHGAKRGLENNKAKQLRNKLWEQSMAGFTTEKPGIELEEQSIAVDAGKQFWRKAVPRGGRQQTNVNGNGK